MRLINTAFAFAALFHLSLGSSLLPSDLPQGVWSASLDDEKPDFIKISNVPGQPAKSGALRVLDGTEFNTARADADSTLSKRDTTGCTGNNVIPLHYYAGYVNAWVSHHLCFVFVFQT